MEENTPKCEECTHFKIKTSIAPKFGIPLWPTFECTKHNYHPFVSRRHEGLCGANGNTYTKISKLRRFGEFLSED